MTIRRTGRITSIILIVILLMQFIPAVTAAFSGELGHNRVQFLFNTQKQENLIVNPENSKFTYKPPVSKVHLLSPAEVSQNFQTEQRLQRRDAVFDYRQSIQRRISEYFHGSKYRNGSLFI